MPYPRKLTDEQRLDALAEYRAEQGVWGIKSRIARKYGVTLQSMCSILDRAAQREASKASRGTLSTEEQP